MNNDNHNLIEKHIRNMKPDPRASDDFFSTLRNRLMATGISVPLAERNISFGFLTKNIKIRYTVLGSILATLIIAPLTFFATEYNQVIPDSFALKHLSSSINQKLEINTKGENAFGSLAPIALVQSTASTTDVAATQATLPTVASKAVASSTGVEYAYNGDAILLTENAGTVLRRITGVASSSDFIDFLKNANFGLNAKPLSFNELNVQGIKLSEDKSYGYSIGINVGQGIISINANPAYWPKATTTATTTNDTTILSIASAFLTDHGIDSTIYGKPFVSDTTVIYPLILNSKPVYEQDGSIYGLEVKVDVTNQKVSSVSNLTTQKYDSSNYVLETDSAKVLAAIPATGSTSDTPVSATIITTPKQVLMRSVATDKDGAVTELYVPALLFPVATSTTDAHAVIVPIVKDLLENK